MENYTLKTTSIYSLKQNEFNDNSFKVIRRPAGICAQRKSIAEVQGIEARDAGQLKPNLYFKVDDLDHS